MTTTAANTAQSAGTGDWIEVHGLPGLPPRRGQILHVLGEGRHVHYRVRWDEQHESIFFPTDGTAVIAHPRAPAAPAADH
jgi:hypothetical protein